MGRGSVIISWVIRRRTETGEKREWLAAKNSSIVDNLAVHQIHLCRAVKGKLRPAVGGRYRVQE